MPGTKHKASTGPELRLAAPQASRDAGGSKRRCASVQQLRVDARACVRGAASARRRADARLHSPANRAPHGGRASLMLIVSTPPSPRCWPDPWGRPSCAAQVALARLILVGGVLVAATAHPPALRQPGTCGRRTQMSAVMTTACPPCWLIRLATWPQRVLAARGERELRALFRSFKRGGQADAAGSARDDTDLPRCDWVGVIQQVGPSWRPTQVAQLVVGRQRTSDRMPSSANRARRRPVSCCPTHPST